MFWIRLLLAVLAAGQAVAALPEVQPPFMPSKSGRQEVALRAFDVTSRKGGTRPALTLSSGNKAVTLNGLDPSGAFEDNKEFFVLVDGVPLLQGMFEGGVKDGGDGFPFQAKEGTEPEVGFDAGMRRATFSKQCRLGPSRSTAYSHTLTAQQDGKVRLSWDLGLSSKACRALRGKLGFSLKLCLLPPCRGLGVSVDGKALELSSVEALKRLQADASGVKSRPLKDFKRCKVLTVAPDKPLAGFSLRFEGKPAVKVSERYYQDKYNLCVSVPCADMPVGSLVIDLGVTALTEPDAPPPLGGVDFWADDRLRVPVPTTRNLMPNPSFEQGLRYWRWVGGGGNYVPSDAPAYSLSDDAKFGSSSLLVQNEGGGLGIMSFPIPVLPGHDYTVSFHAKAAKPDTAVYFGAGSALRLDGSAMGWERAAKRRHGLSTEWRRYSFSFKSDTLALQLFVAPVGGFVWIDGVQVEEGAEPTGYVGPAVEGRLLTADPDCLLALGQSPDARFELSGEPGLKGALTLSARDYYCGELFRRDYPFELGPDGLATLPLPLDAAALGTGIFVLRADFAWGKERYTDHYRFSIMDFLENKHPSKNLFGTIITMRSPRGGDAARDLMRWGFGSTAYSFDSRLAEQYRIRNFAVPIYEELLPEERADYYSALGHWMVGEGKAAPWPEFTPERLRRVEEICHDVVARNPEVPVWAPTCEVECHSPMVKAGNYAEWAKFQAAFAKGVKSANPRAAILPDTGSSGLGPGRGFDVQEGFMRATRGLVKWDAFAAHPYGSLDLTCGWEDLDATTDRFVKLMAKHGYGPETPIYYTEGFNVTDTKITAWGAGGSYDAYPSGRPSYDAGWREFMQAAWAARSYLVCLKYWPKVRIFNIWVVAPYFDLDFAPLFVCGVPNTLGRLLPDPAFKADLRPADGVRGYAFADGRGKGVVAVWCALDKVDNGLVPGPRLLARFGPDAPEFIDLMGNRRAPTLKGPVTVIPLTPAPLFLRCPEESLDKLLKALGSARVAGLAEQ